MNSTRRGCKARAFAAGARATPKAPSPPCSPPCANWPNKGPRPAETEIVFAGLVDEEHAQAGSRALAAGGCKADLAIVGEPTRLRIVTAHKGSLWLGLATRGKSAHGARPHLGRNAVLEMAQVVCLLETDYARRLRRRRHPLLGHATVSVGVIAGGTQPNIVPAACRITVDRRTLPGETEKSVRAEMMALFRRRKLRVRIEEQKPAPCLPLETDARLPLVRQFFRVAGQKKAAGADYFCDAAVLAQAGIASVVFGPGDIAQAHTADEWIARKSLQAADGAAVKVLAVVAIKLMSSTGKSSFFRQSGWMVVVHLSRRHFHGRSSNRGSARPCDGGIRLQHLYRAAAVAHALWGGAFGGLANDFCPAGRGRPDR